MKTLNRVYLLGSVGRDPELKSTAGGTLVANLSLATSERRKDAAGNWQEETTWHNLIAFGRTAEIIRDYVQKGSPLHIEGRIQNRSWEKDGQKHYRTEIVVDNLILLGGNKEKKQTRTQPTARDIGFESQDITDDDIPF